MKVANINLLSPSRCNQSFIHVVFYKLIKETEWKLAPSNYMKLQYEQATQR